jgi:hypothetical protein
MQLAAVPNLEHELDELYALPLERFTKARNDLAARLRKAHQGDAAAIVRALKKPSAAAWAAALLEAGARLRETQQQAIGGTARAEDVSEAAGGQRDAVRVLLTAARKLLGSRATPALLDRLSQTLLAASIEDEGRALLQRGRLTEELKAVGFGPLEAVKPSRRRDEVARAARERVTALRADARRLAGEARTAERAASDAARAAGILREEADGKKGEAERAADELAAAEEDLRSRR